MKKLLSLRNILIFVAALAAFLIVHYLYLNKVGNGLAVKIENWSLYQEISDPKDKFIGTGDCSSNQEFNYLVSLGKAGSMKKLILPGDLELIMTLNYLSWTNEKFLSFNNDATAICAAAGTYPLKGYADKLLWIHHCSGGVIEPSAECQKSEAIVENYFKNK